MVVPPYLILGPLLFNIYICDLFFFVEGDIITSKDEASIKTNDTDTKSSSSNKLLGLLIDNTVNILNILKLSVTPTEQTLQQILRCFGTSKKFPNIVKLLKTTTVIPVMNTWPEPGASFIWQIKRWMQSATKIICWIPCWLFRLMNSYDAIKMIAESADEYEKAQRHKKSNQILFWWNKICIPWCAVQMEIFWYQRLN